MREGIRKAGLLILLSGCAGPEAPVGVARWPIAGGVPDADHGATVFLRGPELDCSGSLVGPHTVVTAKHCVSDGIEGFTVFTGADGGGAQRSVVEVLTTPGDELFGQDIALLTLDGDLEVTPYPIRRDLSDLALDSRLVLVGYGRRPSGESGARYMGESTLFSIGPASGIVDGELGFRGDASACSGDSGGTVLDDEGRLVGVISWGRIDRCSDEDLAVATRVDHHLGMIRDALGLGAPCVRNEDCREGECLAARADEDAVCAERCDGIDPLSGCPPGSYCDHSGDVGLCLLGWPGDGRSLDPCSSNRDCASLLCWEGMCREACGADTDCGFGMHCEQAGAATVGACFSGGTPPDGPADAARPGEVPSVDVGTPCGGNDDCSSRLCGHWPDAPVCTARCESDAACPADFDCVEVESESLCVPAARERTESSCSLVPVTRAPAGVGVLFVAVALLLAARRSSRS